jgi:hypothetical protein
MRFIRRHLGFWTLAWLSCQIASLSAVALRDAGAIAESGKTCFQTGPAEQCPMRGVNGEPCPMHRGADTDHHEKDGSCTLRSTGGGAATVFGSLFSAPGVIPVVSGVPEVVRIAVLSPIDRSLPSASVLLDTPPPRA